MGTVRDILACLVLSAVALLQGCAAGTPSRAFLNDYAMVSPGYSEDSVYEDHNMRVSMTIKNDRMFGLEIRNKTGGSMRVTWGNCTIVDVTGEAGPLRHAGVGGKTAGDVTSITPGGSVSAEVYPASHVYTDERGEEGIYPLYYRGALEGKPGDLYGRTVGVNLVMEVGDYTRLFPIMLKVNPPRPGMHKKAPAKRGKPYGYPDFIN